MANLQNKGNIPLPLPWHAVLLTAGGGLSSHLPEWTERMQMQCKVTDEACQVSSQCRWEAPEALHLPQHHATCPHRL